MPDHVASDHDYCLEGILIPTLTDSLLSKHSAGFNSFSDGYTEIQPQDIAINQGVFTSASRLAYFPTVIVKQTEQSLLVSCTCDLPKVRLCEHQVQVLASLIRRRELRIFFDQALRYQAIRQVAQDYGLENEPSLDDLFELSHENKFVNIKPKRKELISLTQADKDYLTAQLVPKSAHKLSVPNEPAPTLKRILVFTKHRFYDHFCLELFEAATAGNGKLKSPFTALQPLDLLGKVDNLDAVKFYSAVAKFQNHHRTKNEQADLEALRLVAVNPLKLPVFYHSGSVSENISSGSLVPIKLASQTTNLRLTVQQVDNFYEVWGAITLNGATYGLHQLTLKYDYFILLYDTLYLIEGADYLRVIQFFAKQNNGIVLHQSKYNAFQQEILAKLEDRVPIRYAYLKPATPAQLTEKGFDLERERIIYLSDTENYVVLTPVMKYGSVEVPVLSQRQIHSVDRKGKPFMVARDEEAEIQFVMAVMTQHPDFQDQLNQNEFFLHKKHVLEDGWFLDAFENWSSQSIRILGFNTLRNNRLNQHKAKVSVIVSSGQNWFETSLGLSYGKQQVSLKHLHRAIKNKSRFVTLDDGTQGLLPTEWLDRFTAYFQAGDIVDDRIRTPKISFASIQELYAEEELLNDVKDQLALYTKNFASFDSVRPVAVPAELRATLRDYQKEGLNWLNFLDELGFGGCLADDMGLGKTLQIIAFILLQKQKKRVSTNLIVVPTSLLFNWQAEAAKFAPTLSLHTFYGANRGLTKKEFDQYDIILTSYGTLLSDIRFLKEYLFNYIVLDESQAIKNPESQRYQAVRLLQSRNKLVLTGTPIENHTFDLYGQLSFACPGLLGSYNHFKAHYSTPIDKFADQTRARELQKKISPFILRRTKAQVATELPDKTEMILHCEMGLEQRRVYDAYEREFRNFLLTTKEGDIPRERLHVLQGLTKLRQICNSPVLLNDDEFYGDSSAKIEMLMEQIESKSPNHKILVFSQFVAMLDLIRKELESRQIGFEYLTGQTSNRGAIVDRFQTDDSIRVFLISLKAGGTGLNLTQADYVYLVDPWWNPAVENQAIDRSHRIGQTKNVIAVRLICPNTIEEKILLLQESKQELADTLVKTDASIVKSLSKSDLLNLLS
ncbi:DEAD/DEAH box helicase [Spirosoma sp. KCTC 42546]|uniref:DEAD/DEAH box helicase n=1 Tax=Spirosoma sp. KCTC 42546 TaxID=2520506 RepID=UPI0011594FC3|nr:DEAD/DEAH box helicase [Spirosoma sp. KCTC 42546]QDK78377.1 DEAD/DEAH box helicase [Spirosoma sp. KCTC 42546]